ncbi:hypothetical protein [Pelomonas sp. BJYL3]|uniref:hypothetical protein n=1 Tax=Pelomonas sp. BJYL3 TaxID=2976697 RepID=UPI0022B5936A|nr:hypothetical protein [Pelomonas sp. BJYL3]
MMHSIFDRLKVSDRLQMAVLALVCIALYGQTVGFSYVWDDGLIFLNKNSLVVEPLSWKLLTEPILEGSSYMRPLVLLTWWLEFHCFGQQPAVSHAVNVALLVVNVLLLRSVARRLLEERGEAAPALWASVAALCYAVHPALIESTAWVSGRFDMLATTGILAASHVFLNFGWSTPLRLAGLVCALLVAVLSKELGVVTPVVLLCVWMAVRADERQTFRQNLGRALRSEAAVWVTSALVLVAYFVARRLSAGGIYHSTWGTGYLLALVQTQLPLEALKHYVSMAVWPFGRVSIFHPYSALKLDALAVAGNLVVLALTLLTFWFACRRQRPWAWLLIAAFTGIVLVLHFIPLSIADNIAQERFMTAPLAFVAMALVIFPWRQTVGQHLRARACKMVSVLALGGWLAFSALVTVSLVPLWERPEILWRWASFQHPDVDNVRHNYLEAALTSNHFDWAQTEIERLLKKHGGLEIGEQIIYASLLMRQGNPESKKYLEGVLYALPKFHDMPDGRAKMAAFPVASGILGSAYTNYALASLLFEGNADEALKNNAISRWYLQSFDSGYISYTDAAIYYASGNFEQADKIMEKNQSIYFYNKAGMIKQVHDVVRIFCDRRQDISASARDTCTRLQKRQFFEAGK